MQDPCLSDGLLGALAFRLRVLGKIAATSSILAIVFGTNTSESTSAVKMCLEPRPQRCRGGCKGQSMDELLIARTVARIIPALHASGTMDNDFVWPLLSILFTGTSTDTRAKSVLVLMAALGVQPSHVQAIQHHMAKDDAWPARLGKEISCRFAAILQTSCKPGDFSMRIIEMLSGAVNTA
jgi:hypothetical protein